MSTLEAIILGIIQGLTEFLPVSSSGHLELGQKLMGMKNLDHYIIFDLVCHLGTLLAIFYIFFPQIKNILAFDRVGLYQIILGTLPLFPLLLIMKPIESIFDQPQNLGYCFLLTAVLLYAGIRFGRSESFEALHKRQWRNPVVIGIFQAVAILPGVSRSGSTISAARLLGWQKQDALAFSFMLAIPAILGGTALELFKLFFKPGLHAPDSIGFVQYAAGFATSFVIGCAALLLLMKLAAKDSRFIYFAWYCFFLGIATTWYFNFAVSF